MNLRRMRGFRALRLLCVLIIVSASALSVAAQTCGPIYSPGNPYPCSNGGNCTFYAWYKTSSVWGQRLPAFSKNAYYPSGDAKYWAGQASLAGWPVSFEPGSRTIGVSSTRSTSGHVWWVEYLSGTTTIGSEMNWGVWGVKSPVQYSFSMADKGYIYPKAMWWRPVVYFTLAPVLYARSYDQSIGLYGTNFKPGMVVDVTFPGGTGMATLQGSQVQYSSASYVTIRATLNARGWWKFRVVASDGQRSDPVWMFVN